MEMNILAADRLRSSSLDQHSDWLIASIGAYLIIALARHERGFLNVYLNQASRASMQRLLLVFCLLPQACESQY